MMSFGDTEINDVSAIEVFEENNVLWVKKVGRIIDSSSS